jgi:sulfur carrier protein
MLKIIVNGEQLDLPSPVNIRDLLKHLKITTPAVAVEVNHRIVNSCDYDNIKVREGDVLEIVTLVGGG